MRIAYAKGRPLPHVERRADQGYRQDIVTAIASGEAYGTPDAEGASYLDVLEVRNVAGEVALAVVVASDLKAAVAPRIEPRVDVVRSEEHTSELQSLMRISYAVFCLKKKKNK